MKLLKGKSNSALLVVLVSLFVAIPVSAAMPGALMGYAVDALFILVLLAALNAERGGISWRRPGVYVLLAAFALRFAATTYEGDLGNDTYCLYLVVVEIFTAAFIFHLCYTLLRNLGFNRTVGRETIAGVASVYILLAIAFSSLHTAVFVFEGERGAYNGQGLVWKEKVLETSALAEWAPIFSYYSVVTQTTLGYGDITPRTPLSRGLTMTQTMLGQLYIAIVLARIVAMELASRKRDDAE